MSTPFSEVILFVWAIGCSLWSVSLIIQSVRTKRRILEFYRQRDRWLARCSKIERMYNDINNR